MAEFQSSQATKSGTRKRMTPKHGMIEVSSRSDSKTKLSSRRSSTPLHGKMNPLLQAQKSKEVYLQYLKGKRANKKLKRMNQSMSPVSASKNTPKGVGLVAQQHGTFDNARCGTDMESYRDYIEQTATSHGYIGNQTIPFVKKVPGGEAAYDKSAMKRSSRAMVTHDSDRDINYEHSGRNFASANHLQLKGGINSGRSYLFSSTGNKNDSPQEKRKSALKVFKDHLPPESRSIASGQAQFNAGVRPEKLAKVDLA